MKLSRAARYFDTCPVYDGYTGTLLFKVQTSTFLESAVEGSTAARRVISLAPDLVVPAHNVIMALDQLLLVGAGNPDEWAGQTIRQAHWVKVVSDNFQLLSPAQAANSLTGPNHWGQKLFLREVSNTATDAELDPQWQIFLSKSLAPASGYFLKTGTTLYRVRMSTEDVDGFRTCQSDEIAYPVAPAVFTTGQAYNPVTDSYTPTSVNVAGVVIDYFKSHEKRTAADNAYAVGDMSMIVSQSSVTPSINREFEIQAGHRFSGKWRVMNYHAEHDAWNLHIRRA